MVAYQACGALGTPLLCQSDLCWCYFVILQCMARAANHPLLAKLAHEPSDGGIAPAHTHVGWEHCARDPGTFRTCRTLRTCRTMFRNSWACSRHTAKISMLRLNIGSSMLRLSSCILSIGQCSATVVWDLWMLTSSASSGSPQAAVLARWGGSHSCRYRRGLLNFWLQ